MKLNYKEFLPSTPYSLLKRIRVNRTTSSKIHNILTNNDYIEHKNLTNQRYEIKGPINETFWTHYVSNSIENNSSIGKVYTRAGLPVETGWNITTNLHGHLYETSKFDKDLPVYNFQFRVRSYAALSKKYINDIEHTTIFPQKDTNRKSWFEFKCSIKNNKNNNILNNNILNNNIMNNKDNKVDINNDMLYNSSINDKNLFINNNIINNNFNDYSIENIGKITIKRRILLDNMTILKLIYIWNIRNYQNWAKINLKNEYISNNSIIDIFNQIKEEAYDNPLNNHNSVNDIINILSCLYNDEHLFGFDRCSTYTRRAQVLDLNDNKYGKGIKIEMTEDRNLQIYTGEPQKFIENGVLNPSKLILFTPKLVIPQHFIEFKIPYFKQNEVNENVKELYNKILNIIFNMNIKGNIGKTKYVKKYIYGK